MNQKCVCQKMKKKSEIQKRRGSVREGVLERREVMAAGGAGVGGLRGGRSLNSGEWAFRRKEGSAM